MGFVFLGALRRLEQAELQRVADQLGVQAATLELGSGTIRSASPRTTEPPTPVVRGGLDELEVDDVVPSPHRWPGANETAHATGFLHATRGGVNDGADYWRTLRFFRDADPPEVEASTHYTVGHDGELGQSVAVEDAAWHAGVGRRWPGTASLSIEVAQELPTVPFTSAQYATVARIIAAAFHDPRFRIPIEHITPAAASEGARGWIGHDQWSAAGVGSAGKSDPGPLWSWATVMRLARRAAGV